VSISRGIVFPQISADFDADIRRLALCNNLRLPAGKSAFICGEIIPEGTFIWFFMNSNGIVFPQILTQICADWLCAKICVYLREYLRLSAGKYIRRNIYLPSILTNNSAAAAPLFCCCPVIRLPSAMA
jgi:hypothetical protein